MDFGAGHKYLKGHKYSTQQTVSRCQKDSCVDDHV